MTFLLPTLSILRREVTRFLRQKNRIIGAFGTPVVFWIFIGSGLSPAFQFGESKLSYLQYFFPGTIILILLFTAIFSTISIIEDRREGFLQGVLVSPISRSSLVLGKFLAGATLATLQGLLFLLLSPFLNFSVSFHGFFTMTAIIFLLSFGLTGLGYVIAWKLDSTQGFHAIMNLFLMPLWLLSGSVFPLEGAPSWLQIVMKINPLTYGVAALQQGFFQPIEKAGTFVFSPLFCFSVTGFFSLLMFFIAIKVTTK